MIGDGKVDWSALVGGLGSIIENCTQAYKDARKNGKIKIKTTTFEIETKDVEKLIRSFGKALRPKATGVASGIPIVNWPDAGCMGDELSPEEMAKSPAENLKNLFGAQPAASRAAPLGNPCAYCGNPTKMAAWTDNKGKLQPPCCSRDACLDKQAMESVSPAHFGAVGSVESMKATGALPKDTIQVTHSIDDAVDYWRNQTHKEQDF